MTAPERSAALKEFEDSRAAFVDAYAGVPDEALAFLKPGDDYALGGLVVHAIAVLLHYHLVLTSVLDSGFGEVRPKDPPGFWELQAVGARAGLQPEERSSMFAELDRCHEAFVAAVSSLSEDEWDRKAPVWFGDDEPLPTSPSDIWGWLNDHYAEHIPQVGQLHEDWEASRTR